MSVSHKVFPSLWYTVPGSRRVLWALREDEMEEFRRRDGETQDLADIYSSCEAKTIANGVHFTFGASEKVVGEPGYRCVGHGMRFGSRGPK